MNPEFSDIAKKLVYGDRNKSYGPPIEDYSRTSAVWSGLLIHKLKPGARITCEEALIMMVALKLCREMANHKDDNVIDAHGYLECLEWVHKELEALSEEKQQTKKGIISCSDSIKSWRSSKPSTKSNRPSIRRTPKLPMI